MNWKQQSVFLIGIGGVGMAPLAELLIKAGANVSGSDRKCSATTRHLESLGVKICYEQRRTEWFEDELVAYSTDIPVDHIERVSASQMPGVRLLHRSELLQEIVRDSACLAVAGSHGKSTTTGALAYLLSHCGMNHGTLVGGKFQNQQANKTNLDKINTERNKKIEKKYFVIEADESDKTFLRYSPHGAIITHIGNDHLSHYGNVESLQIAFAAFSSNIQSHQHLLVSSTTEEVKKIFGAHVMTYGWREDDSWKIHSHKITPTGQQQFNLTNHKREFGPFTISLIGRHNVENLAAVVALGILLGIPEVQIQEIIPHYNGICRRQEIKQTVPYYIIDDYGHHPFEIKRTIEGVKIHHPAKKVIAVVQFHRYTRFRDQHEHWYGALQAADQIIVTDIYSAGEDPALLETCGSLEKWVEEGLKRQMHLTYVPRDALVSHVRHNALSQEVWLFLGAGDITYIADELVSSQKLLSVSNLPS